MWKVQFEFSTLGKLQCTFSTTQKEWLKIVYKVGSEKFMFHNVQGEYSAVIALE